MQVSLTKTFDVFASFTKSLAGRNTHAIDRAISVGASWSFGRSLPSLMLAGEADTEGADRQMGKCLC